MATRVGALEAERAAAVKVAGVTVAVSAIPAIARSLEAERAAAVKAAVKAAAAADLEATGASLADTMEAEAPKERSKSGAELLLQMTRISALQHILSELSCAPPPAPARRPLPSHVPLLPPQARPPRCR